MLKRLRSRQFGQATIEYIYVLPILLLLFLASLQFIFIYEAKQTLNYATFVGTRAGALNGGSMAAIKDGLAAGLAPLYAHKIGTATELAAVKLGRRTARDELANPKLALIQIVNPTPAALAGFGGTIPNDNLMYRDPTILKSNMNVQDANLLKVRVTYCVRLVVPIIKSMIFGFVVAPPTTAAKIDSTYSGGSIAAPELLKVAPPTNPPNTLCNDPTNPFPYRIPVTAEAVVRMQTPFTDPVANVVAGVWTAP
ncbi:MAG: pilus assembly protein [Gammaproteobacteria bacterium]|nr:pilus assembly protein [Gammaproteobacteria bacterium]MBU1646691.1 pilus assembly protein [Gammaproteobacteria bacterium]MBU1971724.1 pilus assembly protein [Gammaproteobacteria bacterium]